MTPERIKEIRELLEAATPGAWKCDETTKYELHCDACGDVICEDCYDQITVKSTDQYEVLHMALYGMHSLIAPNARLIAAAPTIIAELLEDNARMRRAIEETIYDIYHDAKDTIWHNDGCTVVENLMVSIGEGHVDDPFAWVLRARAAQEG